jgi:uncharacterized membrane protein AbrB (regulator of aidB expression)
MGWGDLPSWLRGLAYGIFVALISSLVNRYIFLISWRVAPLGFLNFAICGLDCIGTGYLILNWLIFPIIFILIWTLKKK